MTGRGPSRDKQALERLPDLVFYLDGDGVLTDYHASDEAKLAHDPDDFLGQRIEDVLPPHVARETRRHLARALATDQLQVFEYQLEVADKRSFFEARMVPIAENEVVALIRDISRRGRVEHDEAVRKRVTEIFLTRPEDDTYAEVLEVVLEVFESRHGFFGYVEPSRGFVCAAMSREVWPERHRPDKDVVFPRDSWESACWGTALRDQRAFVHNELHVTPHGHVPIERSMGAPIVHRGESIGLLHVANRASDYDPSCLALLESLAAMVAPVLAARLERERALRELRAGEARFRDITHSMADWVWEMDREGRLTFCSDNVQDVMGFTPAEMIGTRPLDRMDADESERFRVRFSEFVENPRPLRDHISWTRAKNGRPLCLSLSGVPRFDDDGELVGFRGVARDVTESHRMREEAQRAQKLESVGVLAGGIAHDFNNILTAIFTNASLAKADLAPGGEPHRRLVEVERSLIRARSLTQQLLTFARGGAPVTRPSSMAELVRESARFALAGSNVLCELDASPGLWHAEADPGQISQVLQNLVINASQAMPAGGRVAITVHNTTVEQNDGVPPLAPGRYVCVVVADEGIGIPERHVTRIFDPYFTTKQAGSGLGLSVTYSIIKNHGGHIEVSSTMGEGATFRFYLPAASAPRPSEAAERVDPDLPGRGRLLVMDDDADVRAAIVAILVRTGYVVDAAENGEKAVEAYRDAMDADERYDAVLLDLTVPGAMGGREALEVLQTYDPTVRALVTSGYSNDPVMAEYRLHGFRAVVAKPFLPEELAAAVRRVLVDDAEDAS